MIPQEYTKELVLEMTYNASDITDIHQSNNVSNATQERLQESSEEPEMRDNCCQTRESLFEPRIPDAVMPLGFTTFGVRAPSSQNGTNLHHHHHHYHHRQQLQQSPQQSHQSAQSSQPSSQSSQQSSQQHSVSQCSGCSPASRGRDGSMGICPKHNPIPAPPGWSSHEPNYPVPVPQTAQYPEQLDYPSYQKFHSPKPSREPSIGAYRQSIDKTKFIRQDTLGSGERYGSSMYGSGHGSSNNTSSTSQHSSGNTPTKRQPQPTLDPRYRAEAVIEVDQRRPFSIESTKSAPDVIATHWRRGPGDWEPYKRRHPRQNYPVATCSDSGNKVTVATQSSLDDDASTSSTVEANSSSWSMCRDALDRKKSGEKLLTISDFCDREHSRIGQQSDIGDILTHIYPLKERHVEALAGESTKLEGSTTVSDASGSNSINTNAEPRLDGSIPTSRSINRTGWTTADDSAISRPWRAKAVTKLHDLPILRPPEGFRVPMFRCRTPSLSWQHCGCLSHTHLPQRSAIAWSAFERCNLDPMYRTWPNRATRRLGRPLRRTVGTQSCLDGTRSSLGVLRCVVRSIDMTESSLDQEIGASIPF